MAHRGGPQLGLALFEHMFDVPAYRIGVTALSLPQLEIIQEVITLSVFIPFVILYVRQPIPLNHLRAGLCTVGAVYFIFRS